VRRDGKQIDWEQVRRQLQADRETLERNFAPSADACARILQERAAILARETDADSRPAREFKVLEFIVAGERYAFETRWVREVNVLKDLTTIPGTPSFVFGIANVRGRILSVIDLRRFFELPERGLTQLNKVVILHNESMEFGVLADDIAGVDTLDATALQDALPTLTGVRAEYLLGVTAGRLALLDAERLLGDKNIVVNREVAA
jgi:purine-binding chemotaxis protein CheW